MKMMLPGRTTKDTDNAQLARRTLKSGKPLYLVNTSDRVRPSKAALYIHIVDANGSAHHVNFPDSFLPICITEHIPPDVALNNADLFVYINRGFLAPVSETRAKKVLESSDAVEEQERLESRQRGMRNAETNTPKQKVTPAGKTKFDSIHPEDSGREKDDDNNGPRINKRLITIVGRLQAGQVTVRQARAEVRNIGKITREDLGYLIGNGGRRDPSTAKVDNTLSDWAYGELQRKQLAAAKRRQAKKNKSTQPSA